MADSPSQSNASLQYVQTNTTTETKSAAIETRIKAEGLTGTIEFFQNLNTAATLQSDKFNVGGTVTPGDTQVVKVTHEDGSMDEYINRVQAGDTLRDVLNDIAANLGLDQDLTTSVTTGTTVGTIGVSSATGRGYTLSISGGTGATTLSGLASVTTGTASGAAKRRLISSARFSYGISADARPQVQAYMTHYSGGTAPVIRQSQTIAAYKHPDALSTLMAAAEAEEAPTA